MLSDVPIDLEEKIVGSVAGSSAVDGGVDHVLGGGQVGAPIKLEAIVHL